MRVAIAYDWLNQKIGGGEDTLFKIAAIYPEADIYCLIYNKTKFSRYLKGRRVFSSSLQRYPGFMKKRPNLLLPFIPRSVKKLNFDNYDLVISVSSAWVKNINVPDHTTHICYCFSPARMLWDSWPSYLDTQKIGPFNLGPVSRYVVTRIVSKIRLWDFYSTKNVDSFIAISQYIANRITKYYKRNSYVVYPPVDLKKNYSKKTSDKYYLVLSVLSRYKNIELVIRTFIKNGQDLVIAGDGPDKHRLQNIAKGHSNIKFLGRVSNEKKQSLYAGAKAFIFPSIEDFGITPVEAMNEGTPVIALTGGGLRETVIDGVTGVFFDQPNIDSLQSAINKADVTKFNSKKIHSQASKFAEARFESEFLKIISKILKVNKK